MTNACYTSVQLKFCCETSIDIGFEMTFMDDITTPCHLIWWEGKRETLNEHLNEHFITDWTSAFFWVSLKISLEIFDSVFWVCCDSGKIGKILHSLVLGLFLKCREMHVGFGGWPSIGASDMLCHTWSSPYISCTLYV